MTKLPSSAGPFKPAVLKVAISSAPCIHVAIACGSPPGTAYRALAGSLLASSAGVAPGNRGKPSGTVSQMRPQAVSVWPATEAAGDPDSVASLGVAAAGFDALDDGLVTELGAGLGVGPHAVRISATAGSVSRRRRARVDIGGV